MLFSWSFIESLKKWRRSKIGKNMTPLYVPQKMFKQSSIGPRIFGSDVDCTQFPAQNVPMRYYPTGLEGPEKDLLTANRRPSPGLDNGFQSSEMSAECIVQGGNELLNLREDLGTDSPTEPDDAASSWVLYTTIMDMDLETIFNEVLVAEAVVSQDVEVTIPPIIAEEEEEENLEDPLEAGEPLARTFQAPALETWSCTICWEDRLPCEFPSRTPSKSCFHPTSECCKSCLEQSIVMSSKTRYWNDIRCPACQKLLEHEDVKEFAPKIVFEEYDKFMLVRHLQSIPTFRFCTSPDCDFGQIHYSVDPCSDELAPRTVCSLCSCISCSKHDLPWHESETCDEFDIRVALQNRSQDRGSKKEVKKVTKACPNADCGRRIVKNGGCQHMTCLCRHQFCWDCLATYPFHKWMCRSRGRSIIRSRLVRRLRNYLRDIRS